MKYPLLAVVGGMLLTASLILPAPAQTYQNPFMLELHAGPAAPSESAGDIDVDAGFNLAASLSCSFLNRMLGVYVDAAIDGYDADSPGMLALDSLLLHSYGVGMSHQGSFARSRLGYYLRVGLHSSQLVLADKPCCIPPAAESAR